MARTQAAEYDQRREVILNQAAELFAGHGFFGASVSDIAKACKISKSLIYHYYPSKEEILYAVMASHIEALLEVVEEIDGTAGNAAARLHAMVAKFISVYVGATARQKVLLNELDNLPQDQRAEIVGKQRGLVASVSRLITAIQPGLTNDKRRLTAATMLLFGMINWTKTWYHADGAMSAAELAELATSIMLNGVTGLPVATETSPPPRIGDLVTSSV